MYDLANMVLVLASIKSSYLIHKKFMASLLGHLLSKTVLLLVYQGISHAKLSA